MFHAELKHSPNCGGDHRSYLDHLAGSVVQSSLSHLFLDSDLAAEAEAIKLIIELCEKYNVRCHIVHLSGADSVAIVREARLRGLPITAETCPHYLTIGM